MPEPTFTELAESGCDVSKLNLVWGGFSTANEWTADGRTADGRTADGWTADGRTADGRKEGGRTADGRQGRSGGG